MGVVLWCVGVASGRDVVEVCEATVAWSLQIGEEVPQFLSSDRQW